MLNVLKLARLRTIAAVAHAPFRRLLLLAGIVAVAILLAWVVVPVNGHHAARADGPARNGITITAEGTASLAPDLAHISGAITTQAGAAADALSQNQSTLSAVTTALEAAGASGQDISTSGVQVSPIPGPQGAVTGYQASDQITVKTTDLTKIGDLIQAMVGAGISNLNFVDYALQNPDQLQLLATQAAIANARTRAQAVASTLGVQLGAALNFSFGAGNAGPVAPPTPPPAPPPPLPFPVHTATPAATRPPVRPSSFTATTQVTVTFAISGAAATPAAGQ